MILKILLIFVVINAIKCQAHLQRNYALNTALEQTTEFFEKLRSNYDLDKNVLTKIDGKLMEHVNNISKTIFTRHKRELSEDFNGGIDILKGFQDFNQLNFNNVQDVNFFSLQNELESTWFAVILNTSNISLFRINDSVFYHIAAYPLINGVQITVNSCTYGALLIVKNQDGSILVLRFTKDKENYHLYAIQNFESNVTHLAIWHGMNQLYLGIASHSSISIFTWLDDYFDLVQVINHGTKKLIPFYSKGFMYLAATGSTTLIFKYFLRSNEFVLTQRLPLSQDVSSFQLRESHFTEHFLSLSTESSIVIYKEIHDRFVPFQQIFSGRSTVSMISNKVILLLSLYEDTVITYQYNGWRFVELHVKLSQIHQFRRVTLYEKDLLLVKYKNDTWALKQLTWTKNKSYKDLQEEIKVWNIDAMKTTQRTLKEIPDLKNPIRILRGHISQLFVHNINEHNARALRNVSHQYKKVITKLQEQKNVLSNKLHSNNLILPVLHAQQIQINCKTKCKVNRLKVKEYPNLLSKLKKTIDQNKILNFKIVSVKEIKNWKCPLFSLSVKNVNVDKSINGILLDNFQKNVLKVIGDQEVSGQHIFSSMDVMNAFIPLDIASNLTKQEIRAREVKVRELNLTEGGFLLPLDGPPIVMTGSIEASKVRVKNNIFLKAGLSGNWKKYVSPITVISDSIIVSGDRILEDAKIENLRSEDLITKQAGSIKDILSKAISLRDNVSVSLTLSSDKMVWNNVTLYGLQNWVTANSQDRIRIYGKKHISNNVKVLKSSYETLKFPKIELLLCGATIIVPEIKTAILLVNNITVRSLNSTSVSGNLGEKYSTHNATFLFKPFSLPIERFYHNATIKNISAVHINNTNFTELKRLVSSWIKPNTLKTSIETTNLIVGTLRLPVQFRTDLPKAIGNIISEQNAYIGSMNNINFTDFLANAVKLENMISLANITFDNDFTTNHIYVSHSPLTLTRLEENPNLHKKHIVGSIETKAIHLPKSFTFTENGAPFHIVVKGSATFPSEPAIQNINKIKLEELFMKIWMAPNMTVFNGKNLHIENALIKKNITLDNFSNILNLETWKNISKRVLSKTQAQEMTVSVFLNNVETPLIVGSNASNIKSTVSDFNDMFENALLRDKEQKVKAKWTFNKLKVLGKLNARRKINDMNLKTDVMRHNSEEIIVTGKKTVVILTAENLNGLNFDEWASNALTQEQKISIIEGRKSFNTVTINGMNVSGTIMGHNVNEALLKSANQTISGQTSVQGSINASVLVIDGLINDVNLTTLMNRQLQKQKAVQRIKAKIKLQNALNIVGSLRISGSYGKAELKNFHKNYSNVVPVIEKIKKYSIAAKIINTALRNRAVYINKLEVVKDANVTDTSNENISSQKELCKAKNSSQLCTNDYIVNHILKINSNHFVLIKSILLDENEFIVGIKFDSVCIYVYNNVVKDLSHLQDFHVPKIIDAFVESIRDSLWIALKLTSQTLVLHYQPWKDLQEYVLPATDVFIMSRSPNDQLLLLLSDGVWNLEGLASPQQIIQIPLEGTAETFVSGPAYYVKCTLKNNTTLMRARYVGN